MVKRYQVLCVVLCFAVLSLCVPSRVEAQVIDEVRVGIGHGSVFFARALEPPATLQDDEVEEARFENSWGWAVNVGLRVTESVEVEGYLLNAPGADLSFELQGAPLSLTLDTRAIYAGGNVVYYLSSRGLRPFVKAGIGTRSEDLFSIYGGANHYNFAVNFGGGLTGRVTESIGLRATLDNHVSSYGRLVTASTETEPSIQSDLWLTMSLQWYP